jgi:hypothetical protein
MAGFQRLVLLSIVTLLIALALTMRRGEAHKPITSKYTYNEDVFPVVRDRCGRCHVADGIAPMSLMTYEDARPWAESIHAELVAGHMPPWSADVGAFKNAHRLSAHDFDVILTWATGGNPVGDLSHAPPPIALKNQWMLGEPDMALPLPDVTLSVDKPEETREFALPAGRAAGRSIRAADLLPGTPSMVRSATIFVKSGSAADAPAAVGPETVLALWTPGQDPMTTERGTAFRIPPEATLGVRVHYKKTWSNQGKPLADRSTIGLYFAEPDATEVRALTLVSAPIKAHQDRQIAFGYTLDDDVRAIALRPSEGLANIALNIESVLPDGSRRLIARLNTRRDWAQRYWFTEPVPLPRGSRVEVVATLGEPDALIPPTATATPVQPGDGAPVRVTLDVVPSVTPRTSH